MSKAEKYTVQNARLNSLLDALEKYVNQRNLKSRDHLRSNEIRHDFSKKSTVCSDDEEDAERQTVLIDGKDGKPTDLCIDKTQKDDDNKDKPPPQIGIKTGQGTRKRNFGISSTPLWTNGIIPYEIDSNSFGSSLSLASDLIQNTANNISQTTCVKWRIKTADDQYYVKFQGSANGCWSYVGNIKQTGGQPVNLGSGCLDVSIYCMKYGDNEQ
ncbi:tolloid-like protein 1 [Saccostrea echinata]|uniref:tolloid-like protein 1 n=1 Tax=Saccostrea echinata TaxID=191078 RepID=UPI002A811C5E|nr:tolloid-like protein 1 [Saccostrea echinata]